MKSNTLSWQAQFSDPQLLILLLQNEIILAPSDTVWGLCGSATREAFEKLNKLKVRNEKPYLLLAASVADIRQYAYIPESMEDLLAQIWPGPVTVVFRALPTAPAYMVGQEGTIAFRIPKHEGLQTLLKSMPLLFSTSANVSGKPVPDMFNQIDSNLKELVAACIIPETTEGKQSVVPSTIIDLSKGYLALIREGAVAFSLLQELAKK